MTSQLATPVERESYKAAPSRFANPFAVCWTQPGAIPYVPNEISIRELLQQLTQHAYSGQVVGPHGVGKSTLVTALRNALHADGITTAAMTFARGKDHPPLPLLPSRGVLFVDGFEQLHFAGRLKLIYQCRQQRCGLVVTLHREITRISPWQSWRRLPVLARLAPDFKVAQQLFTLLKENSSTSVTSEDLVSSYHRCRGNLREVWFELYDLHEQRSRQNH